MPLQIDGYDWSPNYTPGTYKPRRWAIQHTAEGARTARDLGAFFRNPASQVSSHTGNDNTTMIQYVRWEDTSWTIGAGNAETWNNEMCGFVAWPRAEWLNNNRGMMDIAALWTIFTCGLGGLNLRHVSAAEMQQGITGYADHKTYNQAFNAGNHTDVSGNWGLGEGFPWDYFDERVQTGQTIQGFLMGLTDAEQAAAYRQIFANGSGIDSLKSSVGAILAKMDIDQPDTFILINTTVNSPWYLIREGENAGPIDGAEADFWKTQRHAAEIRKPDAEFKAFLKYYDEIHS